MIWAAIISVLLVLWIAYDLLQRKHAILHNFPIIGHFRYWLENVGPELRQYIVTSNNEERPFSRDQRSWVYASSKRQNNYFGFGTDNDLELSPNYLIVKHSVFPLNDPPHGDANYDPNYAISSAKVLGGFRQRKHAFRPNSVVNISAMSYGSLSGAAVEAINRGAALAGCLHNTGEGGIASHHRHGGELVWQLGTGYFGCRNGHGKFDESRFLAALASAPVRAIEIKLSQGAKPGRGGVLPAAKVTREISEIRGVPQGQDCISPAAHQSFHDVDSMLDFVERLAEISGLPVGIKSAVGQLDFWVQLADAMQSGNRGVDFINIDGGEGGTGAAPLVFTDHVSLPFKLGFTRVYREFARRGIHQHVVFQGAGRLGFPQLAALAFALGCDTINVAREAMLAIGCIQAQRCHTGHCPTGVATQNWWLQQGLDPTLKSARLANYIVTLRKELMELCHACGKTHPSELDVHDFDIVDACFQARSVAECFGIELDAGIHRSSVRE